MEKEKKLDIEKREEATDEGKLPPLWLLCAVYDEPELEDIRKQIGEIIFNIN